MGRKKMDRANSGEERNSRSMDASSRNESFESTRGMENDRAERTMSAGTHGDAQAGDEGLDDPAMSRAHRDDMSATRMHGDKLGAGQSTDALSSLDSEEAMSANDRSAQSGQQEKSQRSNRTGKRANDERYDNAEGFSGQGGQRENSDRNAEGTGYTGDDDSNTDDSSAGNPLA
jgi:hypothetical protein